MFVKVLHTACSTAFTGAGEASLTHDAHNAGVIEDGDNELLELDLDGELSPGVGELGWRWCWWPWPRVRSALAARLALSAGELGPSSAAGHGRGRARPKP